MLTGIRKNLPGARIIFSTCNEDGVKGLTGYDKLIVSEDPGAFVDHEKAWGKENNINRQIVNTLAALKEVTTPYVLKLRTDFELTGHGFLEYFDRYPKAEEEYRVFAHKILACTYFTRNPRSSYAPYPYHPSDLAFFGRTEDMLKLFDIPLMTEQQAYWDPTGERKYQYIPEQYIFISCLKKNGYPIACQYYNDCNTLGIEQTEHYFATNFIFLDFSQFNLRPHKAIFSVRVNPSNFRSCYTHIEWMQLYKTYVDSQLEVPQFDAEREKIETMYRRYRKYRLLANLCTLPCRSRVLRHRARHRILEFFLGGRDATGR